MTQEEWEKSERFLYARLHENEQKRAADRDALFVWIFALFIAVCLAAAVRASVEGATGSTSNTSRVQDVASPNAFDRDNADIRTLAR